jgi:pimeloyl-ACP methyl ester carboxylesterase
VLPAPTTVVTLGDGRTIAVDDVGECSGLPVVYLHGAPDCRLARHPDDGIAAAIGVRLVAVDRPGYGGSDPQPGGPDIRSWGTDLATVLDTLGVDRVRVVAWSAGAPWAFGAAVALGDRVERIVTYAALAPFEALTDEAAAAASGARAAIAAEVRDGGDVDRLAADLAAVLLPPAPVAMATAREIVLESYDGLARREIDPVSGALDTMATSLAASVARHGDAGLRADMVVQYSPGLSDVVADVRGRVVLVHGVRDAVAGPAVGDWLAARLTDAHVEVWPDAGHHALFPRWRDLLALAVSGAR